MLSIIRTSSIQFAVLAAVVTSSAACTATRYHLDAEEMARFEAAGPITPEFDQQRLLESIDPPGLYRVTNGDLLMIRAPGSLRLEGRSASTSVRAIGTVEYFARVNDNGTIEVPLAGRVQAQGLTVRAIEESIADAVYPDLVSERPSIVVTVEEPHTVPVTVVGAVDQPGVYRLGSDELTLSGALSKAGGIVKTGNLVVGARKIVVYSPHDSETPRVQALPIRGLNVPYYDLRLEGGERIEVERYEPDRFTVVGLVTKPGSYEYPPEIEYNLMQGLATAGGVDRIADPPYATIFRKDTATGEILPATFKIKGNGLAVASGLRLKPGDVVSVGHTHASWTRAFVADVFRINIGFFLDPDDV